MICGIFLLTILGWFSKIYLKLNHSNSIGKVKKGDMYEK